MELPKRKQIRLKDYDYSQNGYYFVTICTKNRKNIFGAVGADSISAPTATVSLPEIIQSFKRYSTIEYIKLVKQNILPPFDKQIWQRGYYEHIIRNEQEYQKIYKYIENNPSKWQEDKYYV
ncbi:MAG: transposase [Clostridia bacterium]|nr:transposase [Clostridia bacterium]